MTREIEHEDSIQQYFEDVFSPNHISVQRDDKNQLIIIETVQEEDGLYEYRHIVTTRMKGRKKLSRSV